jgi:8-oxo-dGTP diphosphatase
MILKAGTILINNDKIGLIYRDYYNDYTFPKGHLESGESLLECAIRETNEETKREVRLLINEEIYVEKYTDSNKNECECHYFLVEDAGKSNNTSLEVHDLVWTDFEKVESLLSYESTKEVWNNIKKIVKEYIDNEKKNN